jgi:uncharacterized protein (DUF1684 family)
MADKFNFLNHFRRRMDQQQPEQPARRRAPIEAPEDTRLPDFASFDVFSPPAACWRELGRGFQACTLFALACLVTPSYVAAQASLRSPAASKPANADHATEITKWRAEREDNLKREDGWLSVAGLFFLDPGDNAFGTAASNAIVLPQGSTAERAGRFTLREGRVFFEVADRVDATLNGQPARSGELRPASSEPARRADLLRVGRLSLAVHRSGPRLAIRLRDPDGPVRRTFTSTRWFPIDPRWRITATFTPFDQPRTVRIVNILGDEVELESPGLVRFTWNGQQRSMLALSDDDELWFIFTDETAGVSTYKAARFLYTALPADGRVVLDFNRAYNPPCAYNPYTTCPLPPKENRLAFAVTAGEKDYPKRWEPR